MAKIQVFIKRSYLDKKNEGPVIIEYTHLYDRWRLNTGIKANPSLIECFFDEDTELWKLKSKRSLKPTERGKLSQSNTILQEINLKISRVILELKSKSLPLSPRNIETEFNKDPRKILQLHSRSVIEWYESFIKIKEKEIGEGINSYRSTYEHFKSFSKDLGSIHPIEINRILLDNFREYLEKLKLEGTTIHKQFKNLRIFLNWVLEQDENNQIRIPSAYKKYNVKARYGDPIGLTVTQFFEFYQMDLSKRRYLERTRDVFVFAVSLGGPRHGDLKRLVDGLRKNGFSVHHNTISYFEGKTGNAHQEIALNKIGLDILEKYSFTIPRVPTNQRMNKNLKTIAELLEWNEVKYIPKYDDFGKLTKVDEVPLKEIFSTKFMRKTAATIDNIVGVPVKTSMKRTGHKTFAAYSRYVDVNKDSLEKANRQWDHLVLEKLNIQAQ